jgi:two-component system, cell cycle sensor histidine kinase and response regulator CckA
MRLGRRLAEVLALLTAGLAALALWSWGAGVTDLLTPGPRRLPTAPSAALLLMGLGWALFVWNRWPERPGVVWACRALGAVTLLIGLLAALRCLLGWGSPLEAWLVQRMELTPRGLIGQMSPFCGVAFCVLATAFLLRLRTRPSLLLQRFSLLCLVCLLLWTATAAAGYAFRKPWLYGSSYSPVALATVVSLGLASLALLCIGRSAAGATPVPESEGSSVSNLVLVPLLVFVLLAGGIGAFSALYLRYLQADDRRDARELLAAVGSLKAAQVTQWRTNRLNDARFIAQSGVVARQAQAWLAAPGSEAARTALLQSLTLIKGGDRYAAVAFFDTNLNLRLAVSGNFNEPSGGLRQLCALALQTNLPVFSELQGEAGGAEAHLDLLVPVLAPTSAGAGEPPNPASPNPNPSRAVAQVPVGVLLLRLDPAQFLFPFLDSWPTPSRSAEFSLIRREGDSVRLLNRPRHAPKAAPSLALPLDQKGNTVMSQAVLGRPGVLEGGDYRGVAVVASVHPIAGSSWFLLAKMDREEIYASLWLEAVLTLSVTVVLAAVAGLVARLLWKSREAALTRRQLAAERQRLALAQRVEHLMKQANDAILLYDTRDKRFLEANDRALALYGYSLAELQALSPAQLRAKETRAQFSLHAEELQQHGQMVYEGWHQRKDGSVFPVEVSAKDIEIGGARYWLAFVRDITNRKSRDKEIARLTQLYATLSALNRSLVRVRSRQELFQTACTVAAQHAGFKLAWIGCVDPQTQQIRPVARAGDSLGYLDQVSVYVNEQSEAQCPAVRCIREQRACLCNEFASNVHAGPWQEAAQACGLQAAAALPLTLDGEVSGAFVVYASEPGVFQDKEVALLEEMALDISCALHHLEQESKRRQAEQLLEANERQLRTIIRTAHDGFWLLDAHGRFLEVNDMACRMTGFSREELLQLRIQDLEASESPAEIAVHQARIRSRGWDHFQTRLRRKDGGVFDAELSVNFLEQGGGRFVAFCRDITDRKQAEAALQASEQRYRALFEAGSDAIFLGDITPDGVAGNFIEVNELACQRLGYTREELLQKSPLQIDPCMDPVRLCELLEQLRTQGSIVFQTEHRAKDGRRIPVEISCRLFEREGKPMVLSIARDLTERAAAEAALQSRQVELSAIYDHAPIVMCLLDEELRIVRINRAGSQFAGRPEAELLGLRSGELLGCINTPNELGGCGCGVPCEQCALHGAMKHSLATGQSHLGLETRPRLKRDNRIQECSVLVSTARLVIDGTPRVLLCAEDATARRQAEAALRESERRFRDMMENVQLVAVIQDGQGRILFCNEHLLRLAGWQRDEVLGHDYFEVFIPAEQQQHMRQVAGSVLGGTPVPHFENEIITRKGERRLIAWNNTSLKNVAGQIVGIASIGEDITGRRQLEAQLRQAQKMEAIGQLAGGVAHDFNNILAATMLSLELLMMDASLSAETQLTLKELMAHAQRAAGLTRQLLLFSRRSVMQVQALDVNEVVEHLLKMLRRLIGEHIQLEWHAKSQLPHVMADAGMLEQVVMNLVVNARDAMAKGGQLTLATDALELGPEQARQIQGFPAACPGRFVCLAVTDTGCGMDDTVLKRIFEPFFTTKEAGKGTGLGLATVYGIVGQHQGWVTVESQVGKGSSFRVYLPAAEKPVAEGAVAPKAEPARGGSETILLVEDDPAVRKTTRGFLRRWGYQVLEAEDGVKALSVWQAHQQQVDLLLTDMVMPAGISGLELAERLRATKPNLKVIISSGYSNELLQHGTAGLEGILYSPKPCPPAELAAILRRCLEAPSADPKS